MATTVTLSIFSGRKNPQTQLSGEAERELLGRVRRLRGGSPQRVKDVRPFGMGVFRVTREDKAQFLCGGGLIEFGLYPFSYPDNEGIERFLIDVFPDTVVSNALKRKLKAYIKERHRPPSALKRYKRCKPNPAIDARPFDPNWGTVGFNHLPCNNCYDYANDQVTDTYSQPGYGGGQVFADHTPAAITAAAIRDGLASVPNLSDPLKKPGSGWYVALLLGSVPTASGKREADYHWLRQNKNGCWSHKIGGDSVWNTDSNFKPIYDPQAAAYDWGLIHYNKFGGYFRTNDKVIIQGYGPKWCHDWGW